MDVCVFVKARVYKEIRESQTAKTVSPSRNKGTGYRFYSER